MQEQTELNVNNVHEPASHEGGKSELPVQRAGPPLKAGLTGPAFLLPLGWCLMSDRTKGCRGCPSIPRVIDSKLWLCRAGGYDRTQRALSQHLVDAGLHKH